MSRKHKHAAHDAHPDERWLLTYADMITLLMALFIVMFSISNVNKGKFDELSKSLNSAFNGPPVVQGGESIKETGAEAGVPTPAAAPPRPSLQEAFAPQSTGQAASAQQEEDDLKRLQHMIETAAARAGIREKVQTEISKDGLTVRLKTDGLLFDPGSAALKPGALPLIRDLARVLRVDGRHAINVSGHTDSQPVSGQYPTNWELSTARAAAVVRQLITDKVSPARMTATGRAFYDPIATNATVVGRASNRRVELFLPRSYDVSKKRQSEAAGGRTAWSTPATDEAGNETDPAVAAELEASDTATRFSETPSTETSTSESSH